MSLYKITSSKKKYGFFIILGSIFLITTTATHAKAADCKLIKSYHGLQDKIKSLMQTIAAQSSERKKISVDIDNLRITESVAGISQEQCLSEAKSECQISPETKDIVTSKKIAVFVNEQQLKVLTCDGFKEFDSSTLDQVKAAKKRHTKDELTEHILKNCGLVDRQLVEDSTAKDAESKIDEVFNTCDAPAVKDIIRGCSVPCLSDLYLRQKNNLAPAPSVRTAN